MNSLRCSNCSFLNFAAASACKRCGLPIESAAETESVSYADVDSQTYPQPTENGSYFWDQPAYQPTYLPPPAPSGSAGGKIVGFAVAIVVIGMVAFLAIPGKKKTGKLNLANISWSEYRSPDNKFSVSLPVAPRESVVSQQTPLGAVPVHVLQAEVGKESGCLLMYADYPLGQMKISEEAVYEYALQGIARKNKSFGAAARKYVTHNGHQGLEFQLKPSADNKLEVDTTFRLFWESPRIYILIAGGPDTPEFSAVQKRCLDSFKMY
jgi:hypothetical protein